MSDIKSPSYIYDAVVAVRNLLAEEQNVLLYLGYWLGTSDARQWQAGGEPNPIVLQQIIREAEQVGPEVAAVLRRHFGVEQ